MSIFSKARVKTAVTNSSRQSFRKTHVTTSDFMQLSCAYSRELVPRQKININVNTFARLLPLPSPTFGDAEIKHHAFFVPWRTVMPGFNDFITDTPHVQSNSGVRPESGIIPYVHRVALDTISYTLCSPSSHFSNRLSGGTQDEYDFVAVYPSSANEYYRLNARGRAVYKLLCSLGYPYVQERSDSPVYVSALPLLGVLRLYLDWYYPSAYVGDERYNTLMAILKHDEVIGYTLTQPDVENILEYCAFVCYDSDYFTSAFDNPAGPNPGLFTSFNIPDISVDTYSLGATSGYLSEVVLQSNGTAIGQAKQPATGPSYPYAPKISQFLLDSLHSLSDYMKRHQLVGSRALDRFLARFGVSLGTDKTDRSYHLGTYIVPIEFGAVMSNSDTEGAALGDYAGQGFAYNNQNPNGNFSFETAEDYGMIYIMTSIVPKIGYVQGIDRSIFHLNKLDFWTPEFDALGCQAISQAELYYDPNSDDEYQTTGYLAMYNKVFGFTPRYAEYKTDKDLLTGDFRIPRLSVAGDTSNSWHLFRLFGNSDSGLFVHSKNFVMPAITNEGHQFDRIFNNTSDEADHFVIVHRFEVNTVFPGKELFDTYDFNEEDGKTIVTEAGGVKIN